MDRLIFPSFSNIFFFVHLLFQERNHCLIVFRDVRETASGTVLECPSLPVFPKDRIARAVRIGVHRTVAEQAVKVSSLHVCMAGKIFAVSVCKEFVSVCDLYLFGLYLFGLRLFDLSVFHTTCSFPNMCYCNNRISSSGNRKNCGIPRFSISR